MRDRGRMGSTGKTEREGRSEGKVHLGSERKEGDGEVGVENGRG